MLSHAYPNNCIYHKLVHRYYTSCSNHCKGLQSHYRNLVDSDQKRLPNHELDRPSPAYIINSHNIARHRNQSSDTWVTSSQWPRNISTDWNNPKIPSKSGHDSDTGWRCKVANNSDRTFYYNLKSLIVQIHEINQRIMINMIIILYHLHQ